MCVFVCVCVSCVRPSGHTHIHTDWHISFFLPFIPWRISKPTPSAHFWTPAPPFFPSLLRLPIEIREGSRLGHRFILFGSRLSKEPRVTCVCVVVVECPIFFDKLFSTIFHFTSPFEFVITHTYRRWWTPTTWTTWQTRRFLFASVVIRICCCVSFFALDPVGLCLDWRFQTHAFTDTHTHTHSLAILKISEIFSTDVWHVSVRLSLWLCECADNDAGCWRRQ